MGEPKQLPTASNNLTFSPEPGFWRWVPAPDRKLLVVATSALGVGIVVGGTGVYLYRRWNDKLNAQVEILSRSLGDVYNELRSLQQGMVHVQESLTLIHKEPGEDGRRRRPRRMQFYDSDSDESSSTVYYSAAEEKEDGKHVLRPILKKKNGFVVASDPESYLRNGVHNGHLNGFAETEIVPFSPVGSPSDEEELFEDACQEMFEEEGKALLFEKEFQRGDRLDIHDVPETPTPFDAMDMVLDSSVTDQQVIDALELIKSKQPSFIDNPGYLWRLSKATFIYGNQCLKHDPPARIALLKQAKEYADAARFLNPSHPDILKWSALTTGGLARYADKTQKINLGLLTRKFLQAALELRPNDASLHHILGRWNYEISQLGWVERTAVRAIFGKYSNVNVEDAKKCFLEAERLRPKMFKSNMYFIAKCCAYQGQKAEARRWLNEALDVKRLCVEDELCDNDIQELMKQL